MMQRCCLCLSMSFVSRIQAVHLNPLLRILSWNCHRIYTHKKCVSIFHSWVFYFLFFLSKLNNWWFNERQTHNLTFPNMHLMLYSRYSQRATTYLLENGRYPCSESSRQIDRCTVYRKMSPVYIARSLP